jgi:hypothetical protein
MQNVLETQKGRIMKKLFLVLPIAVFLAGCAVAPDTPVVAAFNGDSVEIQSSEGATDPAVVAEANRICGTANKRAEIASTRQLPPAHQYDLFPRSSHLFLCL